MNIIALVLLRQPLLYDEKQQRKKRRQGERFGIMTPCESASNRKNRETQRKIFSIFFDGRRPDTPTQEQIEKMWQKCGISASNQPIGNSG